MYVHVCVMYECVCTHIAPPPRSPALNGDSPPPDTPLREKDRDLDTPLREKEREIETPLREKEREVDSPPERERDGDSDVAEKKVEELYDIPVGEYCRLQR